MAAFYEFRLISAIVGLFQKAKACQFYTFQDVLNQVRLVKDPLLQMHSAKELFELRTQLKGAVDFGMRADRGELDSDDILGLMRAASVNSNLDGGRRNATELLPPRTVHPERSETASKSSS